MFQTELALCFPHPLRFFDTGLWSQSILRNFVHHDQNMHAVNDIAMSMKIVCWGSSSSSRKFYSAGDTALFDENQFHAAGTALQMRGNLRDVLAGHGSVLNCTECKE